MFRVFILYGYAGLMTYLHVSGNLNQYINMNYAYLSLIALFGSLLLGTIQLIMVFRDEDAAAQKHQTPLTHGPDEHVHLGENTWWKKVLVYSLLFYPLLAGFTFPKASLDSNIVSAKGFKFPTNEDAVGDSFVRNQYLKPDTSFYYNKEDYEATMNKDLKPYLKQDTIVLDEKNYLTVMELIYDYPEIFEGKKLTINGFAYVDNKVKSAKNQMFLFRFGVIHCIADSGVFGMLLNLPDDKTYKDDTWLSVTGVIGTEFYAPFKQSIPTLKVEKLSEIKTPKDKYVYRDYY